MEQKSLQFKKDLWPVLIIFIVAAGLRAWPEIKAGIWPIGYDTFNTYAPEILKFDGNFLRWFFSANFLYFLLWPFYKFFGLSPYLIIKIAGPIIYGALAMVFYLFTRKYLKWGRALSLFAGILLVIQLPALRMSWELFRNMLALIFLLPAFYLLDNQQKLKNSLWLILVSILIIISNQLVASLWLMVVVVFLLRELFRKNYQNLISILVAVLPSLFIFYFVLRTPALSSFGGQVNYIGESDKIFNYFSDYKKNLTYNQLFDVIISLFLLCYVYILPFALWGFWLLRKNLILTITTLFLLFGTFSSLIFGGYGLFVWSRWLWMLVVPFTIYTTWGLFSLGQWFINLALIKNRLNSKFINFGLKTLGVIILLAYLGFLSYKNYPFVTTRIKDVKPPFSNEKFNGYFPNTMINNAVGLGEVDNVTSSINYINQKTATNSVIVIDNRYRGMVLTGLDFSQRYVYTYPWSAKVNMDIINDLRAKKLGPTYIIWSVHDKIAGFEQVYRSGQIAVYRDKVTYEYFANQTQ